MIVGNDCFSFTNLAVNRVNALHSDAMLGVAMGMLWRWFFLIV